MTTTLGSEWHISSCGNEYLTKNSLNQDEKQLYNLALNTDLKEICNPVIHEFSNNETPKVILQIHKIRNVSAPKANEESQAAPRMLKLTLTDGDTYIQALELSPIGQINLRSTPPGTKLLITKAKIASGYLLLTPQNCKVLGGVVNSLIEKWEVTKSVQRNRRNSNEDGPPPWVNFGTKIKSGGVEGNFKSLSDKTKDPDDKGTSEFDQQRQEAIAEASSGAVRKVFSGRVKQNVQPATVNSKKFPEKSKDKKEIGKFKGKSITKEIDEKPQKPSEKLSLFAFLEDKLPANTPQNTVYQSQPSKNTFKEPELVTEDSNKYDYKRKKTPIPKQFEKPDCHNKQEKPKLNESKKQIPPTISVDVLQKKSTYSDSKPKQLTTNQNSSYSGNIQHKPQNNNFQQNNQYQMNNHYSHQNGGPINYHNNQESNTYPRPQSNYIPHNMNHPPNFQQPYHVQRVNTNKNAYNRRSFQESPIQNDVNHITQEVHKMAINSQFASRSLRQHLNLDSSRKGENEPGKSTELGIGDEVMAKYWEDGKFYVASIISVTDRTFAVRFRDYGNIEEILKIDCHPIHHRVNNRNSNIQDFDRSKSQTGSIEFRRRNYK